MGFPPTGGDLGLRGGLLSSVEEWCWPRNPSREPGFVSYILLPLCNKALAAITNFVFHLVWVDALSVFLIATPVAST